MGDLNSPDGRASLPDAKLQRTLLSTVVQSVSSLDRDILDAPVTAVDVFWKPPSATFARLRRLEWMA